MNWKENINEKSSGKKMHLQLGEKAMKMHTNICIKCQSKYSSIVRENKDASILTENSNNHRTIFSLLTLHKTERNSFGQASKR